MKKVIAIIGGGSYFIPGIINSMFRYPGVFADAEIRLYDLNADSAQMIGSFCRRLAQAHRFPLTPVVVKDLDAALAGADFVHTTFRVGGIRSLNMDQTIPRRFGYVGNETEGPGGLFMAMRTVPVIVEVAQRMEMCCPNAWLVNFANPTNFLQDAVGRTTSISMLSLCDGYISASAHIAMCLNLPADENGFALDPITTLHAGLNHFGWAYHVRLGQRDLLAELSALDENALLRNINSLNGTMQPRLLKGWRIFKRFGLFPVPMTHMIHNFFYAEHLAAQIENPDFDVTDAGKLQSRWTALANALTEYATVAPEVEKIVTHGRSHANLVVDVMAAIATDSGTLLPVNIPNRGAMGGLTAETIVEVHAPIGKRGAAQPAKVPAFPRSITAFLCTFALFQQLVVEGVLEKNMDKLLEALSMHPHTTSLDQAELVFKEMWTQETEVLGDYWRPATPPLRRD